MFKYFSAAAIAIAMCGCTTAQDAPDDAPSMGERPAGPPAGGAPDLSEAAETLGVTEDALMSALRDSGGPPPNLATAAETLGIEETALREALPPPPQR